MTATLFLIMHLVGLVGYTLLLRKSALTSVNKYLLAALMQTGILIPAFGFLIFSDSVSINLPLWHWLTLLLSGFFIVGLHLTNILALKYLEASQFTIIYNLRLFVTTILGFIFLNELPSGLQVIGGILIFVSIVVLNLHKDQKYKSKPVLFGLLTTFWFSIHATIEKFNVTEIGLANFMFWAMIFATIILWLIVLSDKRINVKSIVPVLKDRQTSKLVVFRTMSAWGYTAALPFGSLALINYVSGMSVALIVLFGVLLLKETDSLKQKAIAVAIAVSGLTLILISKI